MLLRNSWRRAACAGMLSLTILLVSGPAHSATNLLANPGFESGLTGWTAFGNAFAESSNPPQFVPYEGSGLVSMFGNFSGGFNVSGIFQEFAATPGSSWRLWSKSRHYSGDPMIGVMGSGNWVVQKIAFFDAGNIEIGGVESTVLDGTFSTDAWHDNTAVVGTAPANTVKVQALILYLQPAFDGGAAHIDNVAFYDVTGESLPAVAPWGVAVMSLLLGGVATVVLSRRHRATA